jgi:hypothetical protein
MTTALNQRARLLLMLLGSLAALCIGMTSGPDSAHAATSTYCTGWQNPGGFCSGAPRTLYQTYGWGDQGGVCVAPHLGWPRGCTSSAGTGVYSPRLSQPSYLNPYIANNSGGANFVHGVALQP